MTTEVHIDRAAVIARELDLKQISIETQARTNALNFAVALGNSHGNVDSALRLADRLTAWIMTGNDPGALMQLPGAKPPLTKGL
jgi:hypothetical protein